MRFPATALLASLVAVLMGAAGLSLPAAAEAETRTVHFRGESATVPADWPTVRLSERPGACVRLDRRVVYLGTPSESQRCPAGAAVGPQRAIVVDGRAAAPAASASSSARARGSAVTAVAGPSVYTGLGFDACAAPSSRTMRTWKSSSPFEAVGVYIGGRNRACSQPNLTSAWVSEQVQAGWHLIPTYVGLQATTSSCTSCAKLTPSLAVAQAITEADDAVADMEAIGMGPGSPIYFDMEGYTRTATATNSTLTFLSAWTKRVHALGYASGVYSSAGSGIADLVKAVGGIHTLPTNLWIANWDGKQTVKDPFVPDSLWGEQQRIRQFRGGHNETWGGTTINIDSNYLDGATVGPAIVGEQLPPLTISEIKPDGNFVWVRVQCGWEAAYTCPGQIVLRTHVRRHVRGRGGRVLRTEVVRIGVARRSFKLGGGSSHTFRVALTPRGRQLLRERGRLKAGMLVAIPGTKAARSVTLRFAR